MDRRSEREVAARIATARIARCLTQHQLAAAASVSASLLRKIEQGTRPATPRVLQALADAMDLDPGLLAGTTTTTDSRVHNAIPAIRRALDWYAFPEDGPVRPLPKLCRAVADAERWRLSSQYVRIAQEVPQLVAELCRALHTSSEAEHVSVAGLLTSAFRSLDGVAYKFGYHDLSARLIELMQRSAEESGDELLRATVAYVRTEVFFASRNLTAALRMLDDAVAQVPLGSRTVPATYGSLHMRAAVVAGRLGHADLARSHLREAREVANRVAEGVYHGTAFGPASVCVHDLAVAVELNDEQTALRAAEGWSPPTTLPAERRSHYYVDLARAQLWAGQRGAAFGSLQVARQIAPLHVREHPHVRKTITTLLRLRRVPDAELRSFASWLRIA